MHILAVSAILVSLVTVIPQSVDVQEFRKVDYFEVVTKSNGESDEEKRDARLEIDRNAQQLRIDGVADHRAACMVLAGNCERVAFHLKRALQQLVIEDVEQRNEREQGSAGRKGGRREDATAAKG